MYNTIKMPLACLLIMSYTFLYYSIKRRLSTITAKVFEVMSICTVVHLISAVITEYTVNNRGLVPEAFNYICHVVFLISIICVCGLILLYLLLYVERGTGKLQTLQKKALVVICIVGTAAEIFLPIDYIDTPHGSYSLGMKAYALYVVVVYTMVMLIITLFRYRHILKKDKHMVMSVSVIIFIIAAGIQIAFPYMLLTPLAITMIVLGIMITTEDAHLYISYGTGLYNELGCCEILRELILMDAPFKICAYVFLGDPADIEAAMLSVKEKLSLKKNRAICGTLADNVLIVLPQCSLTKSFPLPGKLPEPVCNKKSLIYAMEEFDFDCRKSVQEILDNIRSFKNRFEENNLQRDELTGLLRRNPFIKQVNDMIANGIGFTFIMIDLDDFKSINDLYGHHIGDVVLKYVANTLISALNPADAICRIGGDEYAIALREVTDRDIVHEIVSRIGKYLAVQSVLPDNRCSISLSFGAKIYNAEDGMLSFQEVYTEADAALYKAKRGGKNQLQIAGE